MIEVPEGQVSHGEELKRGEQRDFPLNTPPHPLNYRSGVTMPKQENYWIKKVMRKEKPLEVLKEQVMKKEKPN